MRVERVWVAALLPLSACQLSHAPLMAGQAYHLLQASMAGAEVTASLQDRLDLKLTLYQGGLARVLDARRATLPKGEVTLCFPAVSAQADASSVRLGLPDAGLGVLEQGFNTATLTPTSALAAYVGKAVAVRLPAEGSQAAKTVAATLVSVEGGPLVRIGDQVYLKAPGDIVLPGVPADLSSTPTLHWRLSSPRVAAGRFEAGYLTGGLAWQASYTLAVATSGSQAQLSAWATLTNQAGASFPDAHITVVAGTLGQGHAVPMPAAAMPMAARAAGAEAEGASLDEFHRFELAGTTTLVPDQTRQLPLFAPQTLAIERRYRFESYPGASDQTARAAQARLELKNETGSPLPDGRVLILGPDQALIGSDGLGNTPVDERFHLTLGSAFDVVGQHAQVAVRQLKDKVHEEDYRVTLRNHKDMPVKVDVVEHPVGDWTVTAQSSPGTRVNANELDFLLAVPAGGEAHLSYTTSIRDQ